MLLPAPGDANGYPDIIFTDKWGVKHVWETKAISRAWSAQREAQWYVDQINRRAGWTRESAKQPAAVLGWYIEGPFPSKNGVDDVTGLSSGAVIYYRRNQPVSRRIEERREQAEASGEGSVSIPTHDHTEYDDGPAKAGSGSGDAGFLSRFWSELNNPHSSLPIPLPVPLRIPLVPVEVPLVPVA